jgi:hypothetical protein
MRSCASIRLALSDIIKTSLFYRSRTLHLSFAAFAAVPGKQKTLLTFGKQGWREILIRSSEPAYSRFIQITFLGLPNKCGG